MRKAFLNTAAFLALTTGLGSTTANAAAIEYSKSQQETASELIEQLEQRHYAKLKYDDELSSAHLDNYLENLDGGKMFFTASDIAGFESFRTQMDDDLPKGKLDAGFTIFNRFHEQLIQRLETLVETLPEMVDAMDFSIDERYELDIDKMAWAADEAELDERWRLQIKNQVLNLRLADKPQDEVAETLVKRYQNQLGRVNQYNAQDAFQIYANALTELYDPHTNYFSPRRSENFNINMRLSLEGIGAVLSPEDEYTRVARIVPAGPADKQGELKPSDRIVAVGQDEDGPFEDVIGWRLDEVVELIRGPKGSTVRLQVLPSKGGNDAERKTIKIVRNKVKLEEQSAQKRVLELPKGNGETIRVGVIDIPTFYIDFEAMRRGDENYKSTTRDVKQLIAELEEENVEGVIVDLRRNGGGSLQEANDLTGLFIEYGPTVQIRHSSRRVWRDGKRLRSTYYDGPLVVLINRLSASASEIFAGAIQDYNRGLIVGDRSYGKGTVQTMVPLTEGQLKITESKFYRISGDSTQHRGVVPDISFPSLYDPEEIGESALDNALDWDQINPVRHRRYSNVDSLVPQLTEIFETRSKTNPEFLYLQDQLAVAEENRAITSVSLNESVRREERKQREERSVKIENRRRAALGKEPIASLDDLDEEDGDGEDGEEGNSETSEELADGAADSPTVDVVANNAEIEEVPEEVVSAEEIASEDVLLSEAGSILVDALVLQERAYALTTAKQED
ncbi:carboxy terminal-processing peptidase [Congregibacter brevis]|uniref:Carboxy terminal-processing peptidase n=1 Tax=Congregibacter brevis TaxID=3081201 RepID=A0ABZ0I999_9GAMM|nr:carboxy terminal-processing peptidase [Congregibacter sp. IMCC45268]